MKHLIFTAIVAANILFTPAEVLAGPVERACITSPRKQKSTMLCRCVQQVADQTLTRSEQRRGAKFFRDPHKAQETRQSDNPVTERFWKRWVAFGEAAEQSCR